MNKLIVTALVWAVLLSTAVVWAAEADVADPLAAIKSGDEAARIAAIDALGQGGGQIEGAIPALIGQLGDESAAIRAHAAHSLGRIGSPAKSAAEALVQAVGDQDKHVRREAVRALRSIRPGPEVAIPLFSKLLREADPEVKVWVMDAMAEEGKAVVPVLAEALEHEEGCYWACLVLAEIGPDAVEAVPALVKVIQTDERPEDRREAVLALASIGSGAAPAVDTLIGALDEEDGLLAGPAAYALGSIGAEAKAAEEKIKAQADAEDSPPFLKTVSLWALARMNPDDKELVKQVVPDLVEGLKNSEPRIRAAAAQALIDLDPDPEIIRPVLKEAMESASPEMLNDLLDAVASVGEKAVPRLIAALDAEEARAKAATIIARIGPAAKEAVPALVKALGDGNPETRCEVLFALSAIGPDAAPAVADVAKALEDPEMDVCYAACYALGKIGPEAMPAKAALQKALASDDPFMAMAGAWALAQVHPECSVTCQQSVPVLIKALQEPDALTRLHAAGALECLGPLAKDAVPALNEALKEGDDLFREAANAAIKAIGAPADDAIQVGDTVVTVADETAIRKGATIVAPLPKGAELKVVEVRGKWIGVRAEVDGETKTGWVLRQKVELK